MIQRAPMTYLMVNLVKFRQRKQSERRKSWKSCLSKPLPRLDITSRLSSKKSHRPCPEWIALPRPTPRQTRRSMSQFRQPQMISRPAVPAKPRYSDHRHHQEPIQIDDTQAILTLQFNIFQLPEVVVVLNIICCSHHTPNLFHTLKTFLFFFMAVPP